MKFRGVTKVGGFEFFTLRDCPAIINKTDLVLSAKPGSYLIWKNSVMRGFTATKQEVYECDLVKINGKIVGNIIYHKGFRLLTKEGKLIPFDELSDYEIIKPNPKAVNSMIKKFGDLRTPLRFKFKDAIISMQAFIAPHGDKGISVSSENIDSIVIENVDDIADITGYIDPFTEKVIAYGDMYNGGKVILKQGVPHIMVNGEVKKLQINESEEL